MRLRILSVDEVKAKTPIRIKSPIHLVPFYSQHHDTPDAIFRAYYSGKACAYSFDNGSGSNHASIPHSTLAKLTEQLQYAMDDVIESGSFNTRTANIIGESVAALAKCDWSNRDNDESLHDNCLDKDDDTLHENCHDDCHMSDGCHDECVPRDDCYHTEKYCSCFDDYHLDDACDHDDCLPKDDTCLHKSIEIDKDGDLMCVGCNTYWVKDASTGQYEEVT